MQVKRPLIYVCLFVAVVLAGDRALSYVGDVLLFRSQSRYSRLYDGRAQAEIVFLGNSRGVHSFHAPSVAAATGRETINLSYNALPPTIAEALLNDYIDRNGRPKLLVLEVSNVRVSPEVITELKPYTARSERLAAIFQREQETAYVATQVSPLFRLNGEMFFQNLRYLGRDDQNWVLHRRMSQALIDSVEQEEEMSFPENMQFAPGLTEEEKDAKRRQIRAENLIALAAMVKAAQGQDIQVRVMIAPYWPAFRRKIAEWDAVLATIQTAIGPETRLWDYSLALDDPACFADRIHPNALGAEQLLARMQADGFFEEE